MEENTKQQQLTFEKGITNIPSDAICSDNTLCESIGMVYDNGEHRVIQKPVVHASGMDGDLVYIHKVGTEERYIFLKNGSIEYGGSPLIQVSGEVKVTAIGKTLIVADNDGIRYLLWKGDDNEPYKELGKLPEPKFKFHLTCSETDYVKNTGKTTGMVTYEDGSIKIADDQQENWSNCVVGLYAKNKKAIVEKKCFCLPFLVRTAIELYDGSFTNISQPFLLFPCVTENTTAGQSFDSQLTMVTYFSHLSFSQTQTYDGWDDVVKNLVIFASPGIEVHDTTIDQPLTVTRPDQIRYLDGVFLRGGSTLSTYLKYNAPDSIFPDFFIFTNVRVRLDPMVRLTEKEIKDGITGTSQFFKLCEVGKKPSGGWRDVSEFMERHTLENLTTQQQLVEDDYFTRNALKPTFIYAYNSRLNLANVSRGFFEGFDDFIAWDDSSPSIWRYYVTIKTDTKEYIIQHISESTNMMQGVYFYYPDARAKEVIITNGIVTYKEELTEHPLLNGAYFLKGLPSDQSPAEQKNWIQEPTSIDNDKYEPLPNYIVTSEVNNPFLFRAAGYNKVGTGEIIGISTTTMGLAQDKFGQTDLIVFSKDGIWGMINDGTGLFSSIHPTSRDVCNSPQTITQTDGAVFFSSEKGLMVISESGVRCVSEQLAGKDISFVFDDEELTQSLGNFHDYLKDSFIAYDYRDSLLWIVNPNYDACYVYSIKSGTFGKFALEARVNRVINDYPDYYLQAGSTLYSLLDRDNINIDDNAYNASIITRPMKLENGLALKSIRQAVHIRQFDSDTYSYVENHEGVHVPVTKDKLQLYIYASNNLKDWARLDSLRGAPFKYFRFRYEFTGLNATDRFAGTVIITQETRTNKLR